MDILAKHLKTLNKTYHCLQIKNICTNVKDNRIREKKVLIIDFKYNPVITKRFEDND